MTVSIYLFSLAQNHLLTFQVYDGDFSDKTEHIGTFCCTNIPYLIHSTTNMIRVYFRTDYLSGETGFTATYKFHKGEQRSW